MQHTVSTSLSDFHLAGISYAKTDISTRGLFAFYDTAYESVANEQAKSTVPECYILSTCNRTEVYGFSPDARQLIDLLCKKTQGTADTFEQHAYILDGEEAVKHLYRVTCGLDSQILGDFDIIFQVKKSMWNAKEAGLLGSFTERLINSALQVSKRVKNETQLSAGTVSVSFAVIQYLQKIPNISHKSILLYGVGKIGQSTCKNIISYLGNKDITLINRTETTARKFATEHGISYAPVSALKEKLKTSDIVLVATNSSAPTLHPEYLSDKNKIIIDLSIPKNVHGYIRKIPNIEVMDVDELSQIQDHTLNIRKKEIPHACAIINEQMKDFLYWYKMRKHALLLKAVKGRIESIHEKELSYFKKESPDIGNLEAFSSRAIQKTVNILARKLRKANDETENYYRVISEIFEIPVNE